MDSQPVLVPQWLKEPNNRAQTTNRNQHTTLPAPRHPCFQDKKEQSKFEKDCQRNYKHILSRSRSFKGDEEAEDEESRPSNGFVRSISVNSAYPQESGKWTSNRSDFKQTLSSKWPEKSSYKGDEGELIEQTLRQRTKLLIPRVKQSPRVKGNSLQQQKQRTSGPIALKFVSAAGSQPAQEHSGNFGLVLKRPDTDTAVPHSPVKKVSTAESKTELPKQDCQNHKLSDRQNFFKNLRHNSCFGSKSEEDNSSSSIEFTERELQFLQAMGWKKGDWENCDPLTEKEIADFQASNVYKLYINKRGRGIVSCDGKICNSA